MTTIKVLLRVSAEQSILNILWGVRAGIATRQTDLLHYPVCAPCDVQVASRPGTASSAGRALDGTARPPSGPNRVSSGAPSADADDSSGKQLVVQFLFALTRMLQSETPCICAAFIRQA